MLIAVFITEMVILLKYVVKITSGCCFKLLAGGKGVKTMQKRQREGARGGGR